MAATEVCHRARPDSRSGQRLLPRTPSPAQRQASRIPAAALVAAALVGDRLGREQETQERVVFLMELREPHLWTSSAAWQREARKGGEGRLLEYRNGRQSQRIECLGFHP